jgi:hypothetical protein
MTPSRSFALGLAALTLFLAGCAEQDSTHRIVISVPEQRMLVLENGRPVAGYDVSTSKFCLSDRPGSCGTPLGELAIARKIGAGAPAGAVFKNQHETGEILRPDTPGRDPIVSRILWLRGLESCNRNAFGRYIYIHGTAEEARIGTPASYGCIRMRSADVIRLFDMVGVGTQVDITQETIAQATGYPSMGGRFASAAPAVGMPYPPYPPAAVPRAVALAQQ